MPYIFSAREDSREFRFLVCDDEGGQCSHDAPFLEHRKYTWSKPVEPMTVDMMLAEVKAAELARIVPEEPGVVLPGEGDEIQTFRELEVNPDLGV